MMIKYLYGLKFNVENDRGMGVIEVAIIVVILIGMAVLFKGTIEGVLNTLLDNMSVNDIIT